MTSETQFEYDRRHQATAGYPAWLHVLHANPFQARAGGTERHALDLVAAARLPRAVLAWCEPGAMIAAEVLDGDLARPLFHKYSPPDVSELLESLEVGVVHLHHLLNWPVRSWRAVSARGVPFFYTVHDFYCVCPNRNLFDYATLAPCACDLEPKRTKRCLRAWQSAEGAVLERGGVLAVRRHREEFGALLAGASCVIFPSRRAMDIVRQCYPGLDVRFEVVPHGVNGPPPSCSATAGRGPLRAGVLGAAGHPQKGAEHYVQLVRSTRAEPIEWHFFGDLAPFGYKARLQRASDPARMVFHGAYQRALIADLLQENAIDIVVSTPAVHETFSFTVSEALCAGIPVIATRMGSLEEKLGAAGLSECLVDHPPEAARRLAELARAPGLLRPLRERLRGFRHPTTRENADRILEIYGAAGKALSRRGPAPDPGLRARNFAAWCAALESREADRAPIVAVDPGRGPYWYRLARRFEDWIPAAIQRPLRRHFMARNWEVLAEYRFPPAWPAEAVEAARVQVLRLRLRCRTDGPAHARLFWVHEEGEEFSPRKSLVIPLEPTRRWQDILVDLHECGSRESWLAGPRIARLRLDPLDGAGDFELDSLWLARAR